MSEGTGEQPSQEQMDSWDETREQDPARARYKAYAEVDYRGELAVQKEDVEVAKKLGVKDLGSVVDSPEEINKKLNKIREQAGLEFDTEQKCENMADSIIGDTIKMGSFKLDVEECKWTNRNLTAKILNDVLEGRIYKEGEGQDRGQQISVVDGFSYEITDVEGKNFENATFILKYERPEER